MSIAAPESTPATTPAPRPDHRLLRGQAERFGVHLVDDQLKMEGVDLAAVAAAVDTPAYVYSSAAVTRRFEGLRAALRGRRSRICYAVKANSNQTILRLLARAGAGADIVSGGELERALAAGFDPAAIVFSGVGKRDREIDAAIAARIRAIHAESAEEVRRIAARARLAGVIAPVALRLNPDIDPETHPYLATGLQESKFGIAMADAIEVAGLVAASPSLRLVGVTCHIGSQIHDATPFLAALGRLREVLGELRRRRFELEYLDLGGGLGVAYGLGDPSVEVDAFGEALATATADLDLELVLEPGRYLVGNAGVLLTRVLTRKQSGDKRFVVVDAAMNDLIRPALYQAYHAIVPVRLPAADAPVVRADIVGPICECGDFFARDRAIVWPAAGELLAILSAGAYGMTMASNYNTRPFAPEVVVRGDGFAVTRARRPVAAMLADETYPPWLA